MRTSTPPRHTGTLIGTLMSATQKHIASLNDCSDKREGRIFTAWVFQATYGASMGNKRKSRTRTLPRIACDFNSVGWSGEDDDECYYSFDEKALARHRPHAGMRVFVYESSRENLIMGCEAELEEYQHPITDKVCWRLRPVPNTGYLGELE